MNEREKAIEAARLKVEDSERALQDARCELAIHLGFGNLGVRDQDFPCDSYDPSCSDSDGECCTDGHYMCRECRNRKPDDPEEDIAELATAANKGDG